jgi:hypothetical protein
MFKLISIFNLDESRLENLLRVITLILLSSVKFVAGPTVVYFNQKYDFSFLKTNLYTIIGGMLGVAVFLYISPYIMSFWYWLKLQYHRYFKKRDLYFSDPTVDITEPIEVHYRYISGKKKKIFSPRSRRMVRLWKRYGFAGVAAITPILLSIPLGTFILTRFENKKKKILAYLFVSIVFWSFALTSVFELFHVRSIPEFLP